MDRENLKLSQIIIEQANSGIKTITLSYNLIKAPQLVKKVVDFSTGSNMLMSFVLVLLYYFLEKLVHPETNIDSCAAVTVNKM